MSKPDLSIIIVSYNTLQIILNCINSIIKSVKNITCEIIVVDNASTDETVEEIRNLTLKQNKFASGQEFEILNKNIYLKIIQNKSNLGYSKANNIGIKEASSNYILLLNSDTVVIDDAIEKLAERFKNSENQFQFIGGKLLNQDNSPQASCGPFYSLPMIFAHLFLRGDYWGLTRSSPNQEKSVDWISGACILTKKSYLEKLSGFDENIFMYMDEVDLLYRANKLGYKTLFYPKAYFIHFGSGSSSGKTFPIIQVFKGLKYFYKKHRSPLFCKTLTIMLKLKALIGIILGKLFNNRYLIETYEKAYQVAQMD